MPISQLPWGTEETWATTDAYVAKTLVLRSGATTGPLRSAKRDRTFRVQRGIVSVQVGGDKPRELRAGETLRVAAGVSTVLRAVVECEIVEISSAAIAPGAAVARMAPDLESVIDDDIEVVEEGALSLGETPKPPPPALSLGETPKPPPPALSLGETPKPPPPAPPRPTTDRPGAAVLVIIEDDLLIQDILLRAFGGTYTIHRADDGAHGLALIRALPRVDLVITDVMMPRMSGLELLRLLKSDPLRKGIPVIMLTARASSADVAAAINAGARSYVTKPFKLKELVGQVEKILAARSLP